MDYTPFRQRRLSLLEHIAKAGGGIAIIPTAPERVRNRDTAFPYRADSYFHYLSGFPEPDAVLVLIAGRGDDAPRSIVFCRDKDLDKEIWDGFRFGPDGARETFGFDAAHSFKDFEAQLPDLLTDQPALWYSLGHDAAWDARITAALNAVRVQTRNGKRPPAAIHDVRAVLDRMRLLKDDSEIALMKQAAAIACAAHRRALAFAAPGKYEYEVEAEFLHEFRRRGSQFPAYPPIVASGANACVLHYVDNNRQMRDGDLLLIDAGCELDGYASDITRTFPVNGRFSGPQADVYDLVLDAQSAAIAALKPGATFHDPHDAAVRVLAQGMIDMKLLEGSVDGVIESESYKRYYMHRTSHWLGLDVHDAGEYKTGDEWVALKPGMVLTIEPGCYIRPGDDVPQAFWNIGVRIEDDALVTAGGCEVLTSKAPKTIAGIEQLMKRTHG
ncbi:aminopeptidase P N-terminal domain-containing protein [Sulfurisoma sediminicola]|uniref:Xaa-Pro aminopeptidase n=1 Tax=Sulfurisoma sediminicola TaxID=1381557 RepID=A0A497XK34_9PROT|nr:aminopeptidase P N-terminal domain-containing protein [Sulfurisoma sediminicola]RLJ67730.1 aminopeptidase P [Sulfurisoma sediminicola]